MLTGSNGGEKNVKTNGDAMPLHEIGWRHQTTRQMKALNDGLPRHRASEWGRGRRGGAFWAQMQGNNTC